VPKTKLVPSDSYIGILYILDLIRNLVNTSLYLLSLIFFILLKFHLLICKVNVSFIIYMHDEAILSQTRFIFGLVFVYMRNFEIIYTDKTIII